MNAGERAFSLHPSFLACIPKYRLLKKGELGKKLLKTYSALAREWFIQKEEAYPCFISSDSRKALPLQFTRVDPIFIIDQSCPVCSAGALSLAPSQTPYI